MFEDGVLPCELAGGAAGGVSAPAAPGVPGGEPVSVEAVAGLLGSLGAGGVLASVVEGLLARLLTPVQEPDDDGEGGTGSDGDGPPDAEGLLTDEEAGTPGSDAALVAAAEKLRTMSIEEVAASGLVGLGASGLGELAAACRRLAAWAAACLTGCPELSAHPGQWGPDGTVLGGGTHADGGVGPDGARPVHPLGSGDQRVSDCLCEGCDLSLEEMRL